MLFQVSVALLSENQTTCLTITFSPTFGNNGHLLLQIHHVAHLALVVNPKSELRHLVLCLSDLDLQLAQLLNLVGGLAAPHVFHFIV